MENQKDHFTVCNIAGIRKRVLYSKQPAIDYCNTLERGSFVIIENRPVSDCRTIYTKEVKTDITINTVEDVKAFFKYLLDVWSLNFHPDTEFGNYTNYETGKKTFTPAEVKRLNRYMDRCFKVCRGKADIYLLGIAVKKFLGK